MHLPNSTTIYFISLRQIKNEKTVCSHSLPVMMIQKKLSHLFNDVIQNIIFAAKKIKTRKMKKLNLLLVLAGMFAFSACDDDSDKATPVDPEVSALSGLWNLSLQVPEVQLIVEEDEWFGPEYAEEPYVNPYPSIRLTWTAIDAEKTPNANTLSRIATNLLSKLLPEVVHSVSLSENGELTAEYYPSPIFNPQWDNESQGFVELPEEVVMSTWFLTGMASPWSIDSAKVAEAPNVEYPLYPRTWENAPSGLVSWSLKGGMVNLKLDMEAIKAQIPADGSSVSFDTVIAMLSGFLGEDKLNDLLENGIPLKYKMESDVLTLYIDKEMVAPYMEVLLPLLPGLWEMAMSAVPADMAPLMPMLLPMLGLEKIEDLQTIWERNTDKFEIALHFKRP